MVCDRPVLKNIAELMQIVDECIYEINSNKRHLLFNLYGGIRSRLCKILTKYGNLWNKML